MKKIRVTIKKGSVGKKFPVFNSPESLYVWLNDPDLKIKKDLDPSLGMTIHLREGETMEVEWRGFENVYEKNELVMSAQLVRICKDIKTTFKADKPIVGIHEGWVAEENISFKTRSDKLSTTTLLGGKSRHRFDLDELFEEHPDDIEDLEDIFNIGKEEKPKTIN